MSLRKIVEDSYALAVSLENEERDEALFRAGLIAAEAKDINDPRIGGAVAAVIEALDPTEFGHVGLGFALMCLADSIVKSWTEELACFAT